MSEKRQKKKVIKTPSNEPDIQVDFTEIQLFFLAFSHAALLTFNI